MLESSSNVDLAHLHHEDDILVLLAKLLSVPLATEQTLLLCREDNSADSLNS